jgi:uncharacterized protein YjbI with pentapeptide repeats
MNVYRVQRRPQPWNEHLQNAKHRWLQPFFAIEWVWRWLAFLLGHWAFVEVLEYCGTLSILLGVILYFAETGDREKQKHYQAWQVINTAQGKGGSGGRKEALQELASDGIDLVGVDVSDAFLMGVQLRHANLARASLRSSDLRGASFEGSNLEYADFTSANLRNGSLAKANLRHTIFADSDLNGCTLAGADCQDVDFSRADMRNCDLKDLHWEQITDVKLANLFGAKNLPDGFLAWALQKGAVTIESSDEWAALIAKAQSGGVGGEK